MPHLIAGFLFAAGWMDREQRARTVVRVRLLISIKESCGLTTAQTTSLRNQSPNRLRECLLYTWTGLTLNHETAYTKDWNINHCCSLHNARYFEEREDEPKIN